MNLRSKYLNTRHRLVNLVKGAVFWGGVIVMVAALHIVSIVYSATSNAVQPGEKK